MSPTIVAKRSRVSSLLSRKRPQPSKSNARFSTFVPEKSSRHTLNICEIRCVGTTRNFVRFDKYRMFYDGDASISTMFMAIAVPHFKSVFRKFLNDFLLLLQIAKLIIK